MRLQEFQKLTGQQLDKMDTASLRRLVSAQGQTLNRRLTNIRYNEDASKIQYHNVMESGGRFTTLSHQNKTRHGKPKPMNRKELLYEAKREQQFARSKGSTVSSAKALKVQNQRAGGGQTAKEYAKKKKKEAQAKVREQIYAENRAKGRRANKYTPAQKYAMKQAGKQAYKEAKKAYDDAVTDYWEKYHQYKEEHNVEGSPTEITQNVSKYAFMSKEEREKHFENIVEQYYLNNDEDTIPDNNPLNLVEDEHTEEMRDWLDEDDDNIFK